MENDPKLRESTCDTGINEPELTDLQSGVPAEHVSTPPVTKRTVFKGMLWSALSQYSTQGITFIVSILMARILSPKEYGTVAIIGVFMGFSQIFIDSGLGTALIQKTSPTKEDFCTVFFINIAAGFFFYTLLFFGAPLIARFYEMPILIPAIRVMALSFVIGSFSCVGRAILNKNLQFKKLAYVSLCSSLFSGVIGITLAYIGFGLWALIWQSVLSSMFISIYILAVSRFRPRIIFSKKSFKELFGFSSKLLVSNIIWSVSTNITQLLIGKYFNARNLGIYGRAGAYSRLIPMNISGVLEKILFPVLSAIQHDTTRLNSAFHKFCSVITFYVFGCNMFLMGLAYPIVLITITEKWVDCVPYLQVLCVSTAINAINSVCSKFLLARGFSGIFLRMNAITVPIGLGTFFVMLQLGLMAVVWGELFCAILTTSITIVYLHKCLPFIQLRKILLKIAVSMLIALSVGVAGMLLFRFVLPPTIPWLIICGLGMLGTYLCLSRMIIPNDFREAISIAKK